MTKQDKRDDGKVWLDEAEYVGSFAERGLAVPPFLVFQEYDSEGPFGKPGYWVQSGEEHVEPLPTPPLRASQIGYK